MFGARFLMCFLCFIITVFLSYQICESVENKVKNTLTGCYVNRKKYIVEKLSLTVSVFNLCETTLIRDLSDKSEENEIK